MPFDGEVQPNVMQLVYEMPTSKALKECIMNQMEAAMMLGISKYVPPPDEKLEKLISHKE